MNLAPMTLAGIAIWNLAWSNHEARYPVQFDIVMKALDGQRCNRYRSEEFNQLAIDYGIWHERSVPMYYRHLLEIPDSKRWDEILLIVDTIGKHCDRFVPLARAKLSDPIVQQRALLFILAHGGRADAKAVVSLLLDLDLSSGKVSLILDCLKKFGGKEDINAIRQYGINSYAKNPKINWTYGVELCCKAIETRLEAEAKAATLNK